MKKFFTGKIIGLIIVVVGILVGGFYALNSYIYEEKQAYASEDYKDAEYVIDGVRVRLTDGVSETASAPGSASKIVTRYFGNEVKTDLDGDGREDVAFLLTQETGGSGVFYYVVGALNTERGYVGSDAVLLGDRIAPQTTGVDVSGGKKGVIVVNYADRKVGESMTTRPSMGKSIWLKLDPVSMQWGIVEPNFSGEADTARMTLGMQSWTWVSALYNDGREIRPVGTKPFTLTFGTDGKFSATTDCNSMGGSYVADGDRITFSQMYSTKMYCESSQETEYAKLLENTSGYHFTSRGQLILDLKYDSGSVIFK